MPDKLLIVDDDPDLRSELRDFLDGYEIQEASSGKEALDMLKRANQISLVLLDVMMPGLNGIDVLNEIKRTDPGLGIVIFTGHSSKDVAIEALKGHADDYIEKPLDIERMKEVIEKVLEAKRGKGDIDIAGNDIKSKIEKVKRFAERNCFKKTTLEDAAEAVCLSPKYLSRIFKEHAGKSFSAYRLQIKIQAAKELLEKSGYNINQISDRLGYENAESFIRQFKKLAHNTPTEYRNRFIIKKKRLLTRQLRRLGGERRYRNV